MTPPAPDEGPLRLRPLLLLAALGVGLRLVLLLLSGNPELQSDEANYVYLALAWNRFDVYLDQHRYLWPPGYTWFLGQMLESFHNGALFAVRLTQVLASISVGLTTMLFAYRLFGMRAARIAGVVWALYLPLATFTHLLWNETLFLALFLPAVYQVYRVQSDPDSVAVDARVLGAGLLFGCALYLKESPYYLVPVLALVLVFGAARFGEGVRRGSLLVLTVVAMLLPWGLRNREVYGSFVPVGASLGENVYNGLNAHYRNFDLIPLDVERMRRGQAPLSGVWREGFVASDPETQWDRAEEVENTVARSEENTRRGLAYARENPGWLVRSRVKKLADLVTPMSFYTRHLALGHYDEGPLGGVVARKLTALWALACPVLVLLLGLAGFLRLRDRTGIVIVGACVGYVFATSSLVAMSRFRTPMEPFLIALAAGSLAGSGASLAGWRRGVACVGWASLAFLWWVSFPEVSTIVREMVWRQA